jgi:hypothetical protein
MLPLKEGKGKQKPLPTYVDRGFAEVLVAGTRYIVYRRIDICLGAYLTV